MAPWLVPAVAAALRAVEPTAAWRVVLAVRFRGATELLPDLLDFLKKNTPKKSTTKLAMSGTAFQRTAK